MSTEKIHFTKMQGAGNDYIYVNTLLYSIPDPEKTAKVWSDRHFGIGSDGLVLIGAPSDPSTADFSMRIFNADGSEAMMCGNASRCIGKYVYEKGMTDKTEIRLETKSGIKVIHLHLDPATNTVESVTVDMLEPAFDVPEQYTGGLKGGLFVSMGNPHYVQFVDDLSKVDIAAEGSRLEVDKAFPERCNIEFAQLVSDKTVEGGGSVAPQEAPVSSSVADVILSSSASDADSFSTVKSITSSNHNPQPSLLKPQTFRTRVWERGSGITLACGTGACATAVAAARLGLSGRESYIVMDGGTLHIEWSEKDNHVYMTGPAGFAFEGETSLV